VGEDPTRTRLAPAGELELPALAEVFNEGFSDYLMPLRLDEAAVRSHVDEYDIDLGCSRVVIEETPVAFALIARRDAKGWIGGMGTAPSHRRRGLGEKALVAAIEAARERGTRAVWLEVLEDNKGAIRLYEKLGFERVRDLVVWSLPAVATSGAANGGAGTGRTANGEAANRGTANGGAAGRAAQAGAARAWIGANRPSHEPWQRADATLDNMRARGSRQHGVVVQRNGQVTGAVVYRETESGVSALQIAAIDDAAAAQALLTAAAGRNLRLSNAPVDEPASRALDELGASQVARQHELRLRLS
jgi:ribosomal protein S18 acetylase RimI-like enzyme